MKLALIFLGFLVAAQASILDTLRVGKTEVKTGDKLHWTRQMNILKLFNHYTQTNANTEQHNIAKSYNLETLVNKVEDQDVVKYFLMKWSNNLFLDKDAVFSITNKYHREDARLIVDLFLGFKDFNNFYEFACWTREKMNQEMFLYTLTVAVLNRDDCQGMRLPAMYEIVPNKFFNDEVIEVAKRIKMQQGTTIDNQILERMGVKKVNDRTFLINTFYSCWFLNTNDECKLSYFTDDVDLNNKYFIINAMRPFWMDNTKDDSTMIRRGEYFLFMHQQLLNRYYMERLSNDLGDIPNFSYDRPIATGMTTTLKHFNGLIMPSRPNDFLIYNTWDVQRVDDYERRLKDIVDKGYVMLEDGKMLYLNKPEDIEILGNLIQSNTDCPNRNYYINGLLIAKKLLGNSVDTKDKRFTIPTVLEQYETALRDPMFWQLWKRISTFVTMFKYNLKPYTKQDVCLDGVKITDIKTDKLETYFDTCNSDISNAVYRDDEEMTRNRDKFTFIARQQCLNHHRFNVEIDYTSDKTTDAVVKIFLGPKFDGKGKKIDLGRKFLQIDNFLTNLKTGTNTIRRESTKFWQATRNSTMSFTTLLKKVERCMTSDCDLDMLDFKERFPNRLVLPKGKIDGMTFQLFVSITPVKKTNAFQQCKDLNDKEKTMCNGLFMDDNALGYPLDREVNWIVFNECTNMKMKDVMIYHDTRNDFFTNNRMHTQNLDRDFTINNNKDKYDNTMLNTHGYSGTKVIIDRFGNQHVYNFGHKLDTTDYENKMGKDIIINKGDKDVTINKGDKDITINKGDKDVTIKKGDITINTGNKDTTINKRDKDVTINKDGKDTLVNKIYKDVTGDKMDKDVVVNKVGEDFSIYKTDKDFKFVKEDKDRNFKITKTDDDITITSPYFTKHFDRTKNFNLDWSNSSEESSESDELSKERKMKKEELSKEKKELSKERKTKKEELSKEMKTKKDELSKEMKMKKEELSKEKKDLSKEKRWISKNSHM